MTFFGIPLHPLVVHAAVVLVPLVALGALVIVASARARKRYGSLVALGSVVAAASAAMARLTGEALAGGAPGAGVLADHMMWGNLAPIPVGVLSLSTIALMLIDRLRSGRASVPYLVVAGLTVVAALASLALIGLVGHLGATSVWAG